MTDLTNDFSPSSIRIFYSYSHADEKFRKKLQKHLSALKRNGAILDWYDREITAGSNWSREISENLYHSQVILLLISADFIDSDYCYDVEMKRALEMHERGKAKVIPIILRPVDWAGTPFAKLQALPRDGKPITTWENQDEAWVDVVRGIRAVCWELRGQPRVPKPPGSLEARPSIYSEGKSQHRNKTDSSTIENLQAYYSDQRMKDLITRYNTGFGKLRENLKRQSDNCGEALNDLIESYDKLKYLLDDNGAQKLEEDVRITSAEHINIQKDMEKIEIAIKSAIGRQLRELKKKRKQLTADFEKVGKRLMRLHSYLDSVRETVKKAEIEQQLKELPDQITSTKARLGQLGHILLQLNKLENRLLRTIPVDRSSLLNREYSPDRINILMELNKLSHDNLGILFNDLCRHTVQKPVAPRILHSLLPAIDFQPRPELSILLGWWVDEWHDGVLSLIGLGGSGKTALAHEFITSIRSIRLKPDMQLNGVLPTPDMLFVWSFYDDPNSEGFTHSLLDYLLSYVGKAAQNDFRVDAVTKIEEFLLNHLDLRILLVLDGIERVQEDGTNSALEDGSVLGELQDKPLRKLLRRLADGIGNIRAVVTSRYPLSDLSNWRGRGYQELKLDQLPLDSAIQMLRNRGVQGGDSILTTLVNDFGAHALTLDHLAQILRDFFNGDPRKAAELPSIETLKGNVHGEKQAQRLARLFRFYEQKLPKKEFDVLTILSCFRFPASNATLMQLIVKEKGGKKFGGVQQLSSPELMNALHGLNNRKLVYIEQADAQQNYITHPAVREYFYHRLTNTQDIHRNVVFVLTQRVSEKLVTYDEDNLNLLEELVYHSVKAGDNRNALSIFLDKMGGYQMIGEKFGTYQRGDAILHTFTPLGHVPPGTPYGLTQQQLSDFYLQRSLFAAELGNMRMAVSSLKAHTRRCSQNWQDDNFLQANIRLVNYHIITGELQSAQSLANSFWIEQNDQIKEREIVDLKSFFQSYSGEELKEKIERYKRDHFEERQPLRSCLHVINELTDGNANHVDVPPVLLCDDWWSFHGNFWKVVIQFRRATESTARLIIEHREDILRLDINKHAVRWRVLLACSYIFKEDFKEAEGLLRMCLDWGSRTSSQEIITISKLNLAKLYVLQQKFLEAESAFRAGWLVAEECGYRLHMSELLNVAAETMLLKGEPEAAVSFSERSYKLAGSKECNFIWGVADALYVKGRALRSLRRDKEAEEALRISLKMYEHIRDPNSLKVARLVRYY
ncbi:MAG: TIR domain-containing protein [Pyrinomonadaceae bacterium]